MQRDVDSERAEVTRKRYTPRAIASHVYAYLCRLGSLRCSSALCGLLLLFAPLAIRAQAVVAPKLLDGWRGGFNQQLDDEIQKLSSAPDLRTIGGAHHGLDEQDPLARQTGLPPWLAYEGSEHRTSAVAAILQLQGLPANLLGVAAVESGFARMAVSPKGAAGLWQFMPATARQYGLVVNGSRDDRFDVSKSTVAAAHYLRQLHDQFGDWQLALAAYNAGPHRVRQAMHRVHAGDFRTMSQNFSLPRETLAYVPRVLDWMGRGVSGQNGELPWSEGGVLPGQATRVLPNQYRQAEIVFARPSPD